MNDIFQNIWAATVEQLTDGRWQAQVTPTGTCMSSKWAEADTPEEAIRAALDSMNPEEWEAHITDIGPTNEDFPREKFAV